MTDRRACPECEGRGVLGPRFPEMWERAEHFICRHCDGTGVVEAGASEWDLMIEPLLVAGSSPHNSRSAGHRGRHQRLTLG